MVQSRVGEVNEKARQVTTERRKTAMAEAIRSLREQTGYTQQKLAEALNVTVTAVVRYEMGVRKPKQEVLVGLLDVAMRENLPDLERLFGQELTRDVALLIRVRDAFEGAILQTVLETLRNKRFQHVKGELLGVLAPVALYLHEHGMGSKLHLEPIFDAVLKDARHNNKTPSKKR